MRAAVLLAAVLALALSCESGGGDRFGDDTSGTDTGADGDADGDTDGDADGDSDSDADGDTDGDSDSDTDTDADGDTDTGTGSECVDMDSDWWCAELDCNDSDSSINPGVVEDGDNGLDDDCDGQTDEIVDTSGDGCSDAAKLIYLVDEDQTLYKFDPPAKTFQKIGTITCGASSPFSMAVTRDAVAYVLLSGGAIFEVSTADASCQATPYASGQNGFSTFGMGYATDGPNVTTEKLYVANGSQLAWLDTSWTNHVLGSISGDPELTGNGLGELWGFFPSSSPPHVSNIDKATGGLITTYPLPSLANTPSAWAFAYWGGAFYVFYESFSDASTNVYRVDAATGDMVTWMANTGKRIVGAGVSTCAPLVSK
jgi:hypothetical protein